MIYAGQLHKVGVCAYSNSHRKMEQDPKRGGTGPGLIIALHRRSEKARGDVRAMCLQPRRFCCRIRTEQKPPRDADNIRSNDRACARRIGKGSITLSPVLRQAARAILFLQTIHNWHIDPTNLAAIRAALRTPTPTPSPTARAAELVPA